MKFVFLCVGPPSLWFEAVSLNYPRWGLRDSEVIYMSEAVGRCIADFALENLFSAEPEMLVYFSGITKAVSDALA